MNSMIQEFVGWVVAGVLGLFAWLLKVTFDNSRRISSLEARMDNLPDQTAQKVIDALNSQGGRK